MWLPEDRRDIASGRRQLKVRFVLAFKYSDGLLSRAEAKGKFMCSVKLKAKESLTAS
jgi:hypothetical protein